MNVFQELLDVAGWGRTRPGSARFQARRRIVATLARIRANPIGNTLPRAALTALESALGQVLWARERKAARVQVLGELESTGLTFTHLWVCGLNETRFPSPVNQNPLLPAAVAARTRGTSRNACR